MQIMPTTRGTISRLFGTCILAIPIFVSAACTPTVVDRFVDSYSLPDVPNSKNSSHSTAFEGPPADNSESDSQNVIRVGMTRLQVCEIAGKLYHEVSSEKALLKLPSTPILDERRVSLYFELQALHAAPGDKLVAIILQQQYIQYP